MTSQELGNLREAAGQKRVQKSDVACSESKLEKLPKPARVLATGRPRSKYGAVRSVDADGLKWDSNAERKRWSVLKLLEKNRDILDLQRQVEYPLYIQNKHGHYQNVGTYFADFVYTDRVSEKEIVEDVKGVRTAIYKFKKKFCEALYGITITEVR